MENQELTFTREVAKNMAAMISGSMDIIEKQLNEQFLGHRTSMKELDTAAREKSKESMLSWLEYLYKKSKLSVRRCLLQYLYARDYEVVKAHFELAESLKPGELQHYVPMLCKQVLRFSPEADVELWTVRFAELLTSGQWVYKYIDKKHGEILKKRTITREDTFDLGHGLRFSAEEMGFLLLRTLENDSFQFTNSTDLIHLFCFLTNRSAEEAALMINEYQKYIKALPKAEMQEKDQHFTKAIRASLENTIFSWADAKNGKEQFLSWLKEQSIFLNIPSQTSQNLYYRLAQYYSEIDQFPNDAKDMTDRIMDIIDDSSSLVWTHQSAQSLSCALLLGGEEQKSMNQTSQDDCAPEWFYLHRTPTGTVEKVVIGDRIESILRGTKNATKADFLVLLYKIYQTVFPADGVTLARSYISFAKQILEKANLGPLYIPHCMEYSILASIIMNRMVLDSDLDIFLTEDKSHVGKKSHSKSRGNPRESEQIGSVASSLCQIFKWQTLQNVAQALGEYFAMRAIGDTVVFIPNDGHSCEENLRIFHSGGEVRDFTEKQPGRFLCSVPALMQNEQEAIKDEAKQLMDHIYGKNNYNDTKLYIAQRKLYLAIIGQLMTQKQPSLQFKINGKANMLLTMK